MYKKRSNSFKKSMAFLVFVAFIFTVSPEITHAATKPSSKRLTFRKESTRLISNILSFVSLNLSTSAPNLCFICGVSKIKPKLPYQTKNSSRYGQKQSGFIKGLGNSTSKRKPKSKDNDD